MKILIIQDRLRSGGTERQSVLLANAFSQAGHATTLLTFRPGGVLASTVSTDVTQIALQFIDLHCDWFAPGLKRHVARIAPDIILCMGRMANCYGGSLAKTAPQGRAVIGTMRTGKPLPALFRRSLQRVTHVVSNSRAAGDCLVNQYGVPPAKIDVIANSLVFPETPGESVRQKLRTEQGATADTTVLLDVAMFRPEKNQRELIAIAAGLPADFPWQLWLVGDGSALPACRRLAHELGVNDRVKFFGLQRDPAPWYAAADLAVHASSSESLSNFLIEAQAHGLPAVAYAAQGVDECFLSGDTGMAVPPGEQAAFRDAIHQLAPPDPERQDRARTFARTTFDPKLQVQAYLDLFARLTRS